MTVDEIVNSWKDLYQLISLHCKKDVKVIFTVSPIRHLKDGSHQNQISKSTLLLAVDEICKSFDDCLYFPSYEIMMDELRDYRFYAKDLIHPNETAVEIIWEYFQKACITEEGREVIKKVQKLVKSFHHKAFEPNSTSHQKFLEKLIFDMKSLQDEEGVDFVREIEALHSRSNIA